MDEGSNPHLTGSHSRDTLVWFYSGETDMTFWDWTIFLIIAALIVWWLIESKREMDMEDEKRARKREEWERFMEEMKNKR